MSIINVVKNIKQIHPEYIAIIKVGKFYYSYGKDAYIISYIFNYKIKKINILVSKWNWKGAYFRTVFSSK